MPVPMTTAMRRGSMPASRGAGVAPGLLGGDDGDLLAAVEAPGADAVDLVGRVGGEPRDELGRVLLDPVLGDPADP